MCFFSQGILRSETDDQPPFQRKRYISFLNEEKILITGPCSVTPRFVETPHDRDHDYLVYGIIVGVGRFRTGDKKIRDFYGFLR